MKLSVQRNAEFPANIGPSFRDWFLKDLVTKRGINQRSKWLDNQEANIQWDLGRIDFMEVKDEAELRQEFEKGLAEMKAKYKDSREQARRELRALEELQIYLQSRVLQKE